MAVSEAAPEGQRKRGESIIDSKRSAVTWRLKTESTKGKTSLVVLILTRESASSVRMEHPHKLILPR